MPRVNVRGAGALSFPVPAKLTADSREDLAAHCARIAAARKRPAAEPQGSVPTT